MTSDTAPPGDGAVPEVLALARVVAKLRAEVVGLEGLASTTAVLERAKGVLMALEGLSEDVAYETLLRRAAQGQRTLMEECWITLGRIPAGPASPPVPAAQACPSSEPGPRLRARTATPPRATAAPGTGRSWPGWPTAWPVRTAPTTSPGCCGPHSPTPRVWTA